MLNLLNVIDLFGREINLDKSEILIWLLVSQFVLAMAVIVILIILFARNRRSSKQVQEQQNIEPLVEPEKDEDVVTQTDTLDVNEPVVIKHLQPQAIIYEEESVKSRLNYNMSFTARLIQAEDERKYWYSDIKNELLSCAKTRARMSWKRETFKTGKSVIARLSFRGKTMCLYLPLNAADFVDSKYQLEDVSDNLSYADTPAMYRLKSARRVKYAIELIKIVAQKLGLERIEHTKEDFYLPYEGIVELINKGLVKRTVRTVVDKAAS